MSTTNGVWREGGVSDVSVTHHVIIFIRRKQRARRHGVASRASENMNAYGRSWLCRQRAGAPTCAWWRRGGMNIAGNKRRRGH